MKWSSPGLLLLVVAACDPIAAAIAPSSPAFPDSQPGGLEQTCQRTCAARAASCTVDDCRRGCGLVLDRLAEREGDHVVACVAGSRPRCDARTWSACAARVGPHADGGPPPPPPPSDDALDEK